MRIIFRKQQIICIIGIVMLLMPLLAFADATVHFLDVGQGDAIFIESDGETMLIDGGPPSESSKIFSFLTQRDVSVIDYIISTHPHQDHIGGLSGALHAASARVVFSMYREFDSKQFDSFAKLVDAHGLTMIPAPIGSFIPLGNGTVTFLGPNKHYDNVNDNSIIIRFDYGQRSFLFTGDMESTSEHDTIDLGRNVCVDVLKVAHHGSDSSSSYVFLREAMPAYAIISVGVDNGYDHPAETVLSRLEDAGAAVLRTDQLGDIVFTTDGDDITFTTSR